MAQINRGERSSFENPTLDLYLERAGVLFQPFSLAFEVWSTPSGGPAVQTYPAGGGREAVDLEAHELQVGRYVADWLVPVDEPLGDHELRWFWVAEDGDPEASYVEAFVVGAVVAARAAGFRGYCSLQDCRDAGITAASVSDDRLGDLIERASRDLDSYCRWWFEPREMTLRLDGRGTRRLYTPAPVISLTSVVVGDESYDVDSLIIVEGGPRAGTRFGDAPGFRWDPDANYAPPFPKGQQNVVVRGVFGYTEADGSAMGRVPLSIRDACIMLVSLRRTPIAIGVEGGGAGAGGMGVGQLISIRTKTQSAAWAQRPSSDAPFTGNAEIDSIIKRYRRSGLDSV